MATFRSTRALLQHRQPMIKFVGRRHGAPQSVDHNPHAHPASPKKELPDSFATYRKSAQQHGPLGPNRSPLSSKMQQRVEQGHTAANSPGAASAGALGGAHSGHSLGSIQPGVGEYFDRSELPKRFQRTSFTEAEMEAIETGGASLRA